MTSHSDLDHDAWTPRAHSDTHTHTHSPYRSDKTFDTVNGNFRMCVRIGWNWEGDNADRNSYTDNWLFHRTAQTVFLPQSICDERYLVPLGDDHNAEMVHDRSVWCRRLLEFGMSSTNRWAAFRSIFASVNVWIDFNDSFTQYDKRYSNGRTNWAFGCKFLHSSYE